MKRPTHRSGVSLMEVLISTFVLSIGLLGLAAPPGPLQFIAQQDQVDRLAGLAHVNKYAVDVLVGGSVEMVRDNQLHDNIDTTGIQDHRTQNADLSLYGMRRDAL